MYEYMLDTSKENESSDKNYDGGHSNPPTDVTGNDN